MLGNAFPDVESHLSVSRTGILAQVQSYNGSTWKHGNFILHLCFSMYGYSITEKFESEVAVVSKACKEEFPELLEYFTTNGQSCVSMWAIYARGKLKLLLGKKPRRDSTVGGLLARQTTTIRQLLTATRRHKASSRQPDSVHDYLSIVVKHLSDDILAKVRCQWDYYMVFWSDTTCIKRSDVGEWGVTTRGYTYH
ncbi:Hypothetical protein PHPALM_3490 [Phytophthora palmivora]|uniref:Uncharacterized protein n=1 Tax=Phytophthora palmivora TaxID=4796 RepID=A0A2P4YM98_9STRA|nr:Hypothetical protein PHPALM_3490 [Phytophthora palmivora]